MSVAAPTRKFRSVAPNASATADAARAISSADASAASSPLVPPSAVETHASAPETTEPRSRTQVGGIAFDRLSMPETVAEIVFMASQNSAPRAVFTGNLDHMAQLRRDRDFQAAYSEADLILADGMPLVWLSRIGPTGQRLTERVTGSDLFWELGEASAACGLRLFFLGGADGAADGAADKVRQRFPGANVVGTYCPPFATFDTPEEQAKIQAAVRAARPDVLLVAFGAPKQEKWIAQNKALLQVPVCVGVGGSFEMACGKIKRAPRWMQKTGLEWGFRLAQEPHRLWRRYLLRDVPTLFHLTAQQIRVHKAPRRLRTHNKHK